MPVCPHITRFAMLAYITINAIQRLEYIDSVLGLCDFKGYNRPYMAHLLKCCQLTANGDKHPCHSRASDQRASHLDMGAILFVFDFLLQVLGNLPPLSLVKREFDTVDPFRQKHVINRCMSFLSRNFAADD